VLGLRPRHGTWQVVEDPAHLPAFTPAEAAARLPLERWRRLALTGSHHRLPVRYVAELELGPCYGPACGTRLIAATADPAVPKPEPAWFMTANLSVAEAGTAGVYRICRLRDWTGHSCKPARHELGWADFQVRSEQAIVRHWQVVMLAFTFSLLTTASPGQTGEAPAGDSGTAAGEKSAAPDHLAGHAAAGPQLAVPVDAPAAVLAPLVGRSTPAAGGAA
jgi:hypothetical protein